MERAHCSFQLGDIFLFTLFYILSIIILIILAEGDFSESFIELIRLGIMAGLFCLKDEGVSAWKAYFEKNPDFIFIAPLADEKSTPTEENTLEKVEESSNDLQVEPKESEQFFSGKDTEEVHDMISSVEESEQVELEESLPQLNIDTNSEIKPEQTETLVSDAFSRALSANKTNDIKIDLPTPNTIKILEESDKETKEVIEEKSEIQKEEKLDISSSYTLGSKDFTEQEKFDNSQQAETVEEKSQGITNNQIKENKHSDLWRRSLKPIIISLVLIIAIGAGIRLFKWHKNTKNEKSIMHTRSRFDDCCSFNILQQEM